MAETLPELFARNRPDPATTFIDRPGQPPISYRQVAERTAQLAHALVASGVRVGDRVAVQAEKSPEFLLLYLACVRAGAVLLPMNPAYTDEEVAYLIGDAEPSLVVRDPMRQPMHGGPGIATARRWRPPAGDARRRGPRDVGVAWPTSSRPTSTTCRCAPTTSPPSSTRAAPPAGRRGRCSRSATSPRTRRRSIGSGASGRTTCCCTRCRCSTPMGCSWRRTASSPTAPA